PNPEKLLRSGNSASIIIPTHLENVIIIPQKATLELQDKRLAFILDKEDKIVGVPVKVRPVPGGQFFVVDEGLTEKDQIVIEGIGILTEGTQIKPEFVKASSFLTVEEKK